jgi:hypothetical protein
MSAITQNPTVDRKLVAGAPGLYYLQDGTAIFGCLGSPEGVILADRGSLAIDVNTGLHYRKATNNVTTGWVVDSGNTAVRQLISDTGFGNGAGVETTLLTATVPANTLTANNDAFRIALAGESAANANNKQLRWYFPTATIFFDTGPIAMNNRDWVCELVIGRVNSNTARVWLMMTSESAGGVPFFQNTINNLITPIDWTIDNQFRLTGQGPGANDLVATTIQVFLQKTSTLWAS